MKAVLTFLFKKPSGQALLVGLLVAATAYGARLYYVDLPRKQEVGRAQAGPAQLEAMAEALDAAMSSAPDRDAFVETLPKITQWYPADIPCDGAGSFSPTRAPVWDTLALPKDGESEFQYRFDRHGTGFVLRSRRDTDCDGIYVVHTLRAASDWASVVGTKLTSQNGDE